MCGKENDGMDGHAVEVLGFTDDAEDEVSELGGGPEQQPALQGAGSDLDQGVLWNESQRSRHAILSVNAPVKLRMSRIGFLENSGTALWALPSARTALGHCLRPHCPRPSGSAQTGQRERSR